MGHKFSRFSNSTARNSPNILQYFFYSINTLTGLMPIMCGIFPSQMEMLGIQVVFGNAEIIIWTPYLPWQGFLVIFKRVVVVIQKHLIWIQWFYRNFVNFLKTARDKSLTITMLIVSRIYWMAEMTIWYINKVVLICEPALATDSDFQAVSRQHLNFEFRILLERG